MYNFLVRHYIDFYHDNLIVILPPSNLFFKLIYLYKLIYNSLFTVSSKLNPFKIELVILFI